MTPRHDPNVGRPRGTKLVPPTAAELTTWRECVALSIANGYTPRNVSVFVFTPDEDAHPWDIDDGMVAGRTYKGADFACVYLRRGMPADELRRVCLHELGHAIDKLYEPGKTDRATAEGWAELFTAATLARWDAPGR